MKKIILTLSITVCSIFSANLLFADSITFGTQIPGMTTADCKDKFGTCKLIRGGHGGSVGATFELLATGDFVMTISRGDMEILCPQYIENFNVDTYTVDFPSEFDADDEFNTAMGATTPIRILPGTYSFTTNADNNFVVVIPQGTGE